MNHDPLHHATNAAALAAPILSWSLSLPDIVTIVVGTLTAIYYLIMIYKALTKKD